MPDAVIAAARRRRSSLFLLTALCSGVAAGRESSYVVVLIIATTIRPTPVVPPDPLFSLLISASPFLSPSSFPSSSASLRRRLLHIVVCWMVRRSNIYPRTYLPPPASVWQSGITVPTCRCATAARCRQLLFVAAGLLSSIAYHLLLLIITPAAVLPPPHAPSTAGDTVQLLLAAGCCSRLPRCC